MEKKNIYIDFDGVILDTITPLYNDYQTQNISKENAKEFFVNYPWDTIIDDKYIINSNKFNLAILTHVNSINEAVLKINYLRQYFKDITIIPCPKEVSKTKMIHTKDSILIDDYAGNLREWKQEGGVGVRFNREGNGKGFLTIKDLKEIIDMF